MRAINVNKGLWCRLRLFTTGKSSGRKNRIWHSADHDAVLNLFMKSRRYRWYCDLQWKLMQRFSWKDAECSGHSKTIFKYVNYLTLNLFPRIDLQKCRLLYGAHASLLDKSPHMVAKWGNTQPKCWTHSYNEVKANPSHTSILMGGIESSWASLSSTLKKIEPTRRKQQTFRAEKISKETNE